MNYLPLNFALMANPFNWFIVTLMVLLGGFALSLIAQLSNCTDPADKS